MDKESEHGRAVLRELIPNEKQRRAFVSYACGFERWNPALLIAAVHDANEGPVNVSPQQAAAVRAFIEWI